jgi:hypothetical protein
MAFKNRRAARRITKHPCEMCGCSHVPRDAAHVVDEIKGAGPGDCNALSLCPTCHRVFEDSLRPKLFRALTHAGVEKLPTSWERSNKSSRGSSDE